MISLLLKMKAFGCFIVVGVIASILAQNFKQCCKEENVSKNCQPFCSFDNIQAVSLSITLPFFFHFNAKV